MKKLARVQKPPKKFFKLFDTSFFLKSQCHNSSPTYTNNFIQYFDPTLKPIRTLFKYKRRGCWMGW